MDSMTEGSVQRPSTATEPHHNPALDGVRGLAILFVLGHHLIYINQVATGPLYVWSRALRDSLWCGVDIFFALSGFLITGILVRTLNAPGYFRNFYGRRTLRIFPLYYLVLFLVLACGPWLHVEWGSQVWRLLTYSNHPFPPLQSSGWSFYFGNGVSLVNFWSLHIEEQFYLLWPLLIFLIRLPRRLLALATGLSVLSILLRLYLAAKGVSQISLYSSLASRVDSLLIGAALALLLYTPIRHRVLRAAPLIFAASFAIIAALFILHHGLHWETGSPTLFSLQFTILSIASTALIALCLDTKSLAFRLFSISPMRFFGRYSYGMYIYHSVLPMLILPVLHPLLGTLVLHPTIQHLLTSLTELTATIGVSMLSYHFFELRFLRLKRLFDYRVPESRVSVAESSALS